MSKVKQDLFKKLNVKSESDLLTNTERRVVKLDIASEPVVQQYQFGRLHRAGEGNYASTKAKFGSLSSTDLDRPKRPQRDRRFSINPLLRDPLSIEDEERRVIEEKVRARIEAVADEAKAKAHEQGYKVGLEQGHKEAYQRFAQEAVERLKHFDSMLAAAENAKQEIFRSNERFLMEIVFRMAKMITLKEIQTDKEYVLRLSRELIERVGARENIRIRLNPEDAKTASILKPGLEASLGTLKNVTVETSPQVRQGGCIVESEWNAIDASLETQFQGLYESLIGKSTTEEAGPASASDEPAGEPGSSGGAAT